MNTDTDSIHIDFDVIRDIAYRGVRRTASFLAFGLNSSNTSDFGNFSLQEFSFYDFLNQQRTEDGTVIAVEEYRLWILQNGFRELIESFSIFIDRVFAACYVISHSNTFVDMAKLNHDYKKFTKQPFADRLFRLKADFQVSCEYDDEIISIYRARNCYTHRQGVVGTTDAGTDGSFAVHWVAIDGFTVDPTGGRTPAHLAQGGSILWERGHTLQLENVNRSKIFKVGERLLFSASEVTEVCYFALLCIDKLITKAMEYCQSRGIQVQIPKRE